MQRTPHSLTHSEIAEERYTWGIYKWVPEKMRWSFERFWGRNTSSIKPVLYTRADIGAVPPPGWDPNFNTLLRGYDVFFVRYPAPEIVTLIYDTTDNRFNDKDDV